MQMLSAPCVARHSFLPFYERRLVALRAAMAHAPGLPAGIVHGDAFLDNMLWAPSAPGEKGGPGEPGGLSLVDFEDVCTGPLLFDLAVCIIGCCFVPAPTVVAPPALDVSPTSSPSVSAAPDAATTASVGTGATDVDPGSGGSGGSGGKAAEVLDFGRLEALLKGYNGVRALDAAECTLLPTFMRLALLCNCAWRFVNFNIDHREIEECREGAILVR